MGDDPRATVDTLEPYRPCCMPGVQIQRMDDDLVLFNPRGNRVHLLNATGGAILALCDGTLSDAEIADELDAFYGIGLERATAEVLVFLDDLDDAGVLLRVEGDERLYTRRREEASVARRALRSMVSADDGAALHS